MEDSVVAPELDYKKKNYSYPVYKLSKILPQAGTQTVTVSAAGGSESLFEIPSKVFNLSESYLSFTLTPSAVAGLANWTAYDVFGSIRQIQLYTRGGLFLADVQNFDNYTKGVWKTDIKLEDFLTFDRSAGASGFGQGIRANNLDVGAHPLAARYDNTAANVNYLETQYLAAGTAANNASPVLSYKLNLGLIKNTIFAINKDIFFDEVVVVRIIWNAPNKYFWNATDETSPTAGAVAFSALGTVTISDLTMYVAIETNQEIVQQIMSKKRSPEGLSFLIPYVYNNKINLAGTSQSISLKFNRAHGIKLMKLYHQAFPNVESVNTAYNASNIAQAKITSFYTMLNNNRLQEFDINCAAGEDWMLMRELLKGSLMLSSNVYKYNFVWIDDFSDFNAPLDKNIDDNEYNLMRGLDLSTEQKWDFFATTANANHNHYTFAVVQKMLIIGPNGIQLM